MVLELLQRDQHLQTQLIQTNCQYYFLQIVSQLRLALSYLLMRQADLM